MRLIVFSALLLLVCIPVLHAGGNPPPPLKPVLIVMDIQNAYLPMVPEKDKELGMWIINSLIDKFRDNNLPVIRVYHTDPQQGPPPGSEAFEFPASVKIKPDDPKFVKNFPSAFKKTDLAKYLQEKGCNTVFLCGLSATGCVLATFWGGYDLDFRIYMVKDAIMSHDSKLTDAVEEICDTVDYNGIKLMLDALRR